MSSQSYPSSTSQTQDPSDLLKNVHFSSHSSEPLPETPTASDLLSGSYDPAKLHPMASLGEQLDYLVLDDDKTNDLPGSGTAIPSRGWSDDLCYGTGTMYLGGMSSYASRDQYCLPQFFSRPNRTCPNFTLSAILLSFVLTTCPEPLTRPGPRWCVGLPGGCGQTAGSLEYAATNQQHP